MGWRNYEQTAFGNFRYSRAKRRRKPFQGESSRSSPVVVDGVDDEVESKRLSWWTGVITLQGHAESVGPTASSPPPHPFRLPFGTSFNVLPYAYTGCSLPWITTSSSGQSSLSVDLHSTTLRWFLPACHRVFAA